MFFAREADPVISDIEKRIATFSMVPLENGEGIQASERGSRLLN